MQARKKTVCYVAAHSGGHIIPCLTLAQKEIENNRADILFFTSTKPLDRSIVGQAAFPIKQIMLPIFQKRSWHMAPLLLLSLAYSFFKSFFQFLAAMPDKIVTTGTVVAIPVCLAGWILGIPVELFELNAKPGKTIALLSYCANTVRHCFANTASYFPRNKCIQTPYPIRFLSEPVRSFSLDSFSPTRLTLFVQGGSQGSSFINSLMKDLIKEHPVPLQVIHQAGDQPEEIRELYQKHNIPAHVFSFDPDMGRFYQAADIVLCRSGAGALFETLHFQKPCITIPLPKQASNHQLQNALQAQAQYPGLFHVAQNADMAAKTVNTLLKKALRRIDK